MIKLTPEKPPYYEQGVAVKTYKALISQEGTADPTVIILQNTLGNIVWTRADTGRYLGTLTGAFTLNKTYPTISNNRDSTIFYIIADDADADNITIRSKNESWLSTDDRLFITPILIEVHQ